jgi:hypothetical protein
MFLAVSFTFFRKLATTSYQTPPDKKYGWLLRLSSYQRYAPWPDRMPPRFKVERLEDQHFKLIARI